MTETPPHNCSKERCSQVDQSSWPEPQAHHRLIGSDEIRAARIRIAIGRPREWDA